MAKEEVKKQEAKAIDLGAGEECEGVDFATGVRVGQVVLTGIHAANPNHKDGLEGKIMYYRGVEVRFTYKGVKKAIPMGAVKDVTLA